MKFCIFALANVYAASHEGAAASKECMDKATAMGKMMTEDAECAKLITELSGNPSDADALTLMCTNTCFDKMMDGVTELGAACGADGDASVQQMEAMKPMLSGMCAKNGDKFCFIEMEKIGDPPEACTEEKMMADTCSEECKPFAEKIHAAMGDTCGAVLVDMMKAVAEMDPSQAEAATMVEDMNNAVKTCMAPATTAAPSSAGAVAPALLATSAALFAALA